MATEPIAGTVHRVAGCELVVGPDAWAFAHANRAAIDAHWQLRQATNPGYFNGIIHVLASGAIEQGVFKGTFIRTDFKSFLYWRETGYPAAGVRDAFGSALVRSREGHVLLGRQSEGHINAGLAYLPGGFIDARDADPASRIDIAASIARELAEETGLGAHDLAPEDGYLIIRVGPLVSMVRELRSGLPAQDLRRQILSRLAADPGAELADIVIIRTLADTAGARVPDYTALALAAVLGTGPA